MPGEYGIINVGRVRPEKGTDLFVEAMIDALPQLPKATAIIAGATQPKDHSFRKKLEARIEQNGLTERIRFLGEIPSQDLPALIKGCRALVALPRYEGFGLTPLEGMACGLPVVASKTVPEASGLILATGVAATVPAGFNTALAVRSACP